VSSSSMHYFLYGARLTRAEENKLAGTWWHSGCMEISRMDGAVDAKLSLPGGGCYCGGVVGLANVLTAFSPFKIVWQPS
jgi:hypothetical protein